MTAPPADRPAEPGAGGRYLFLVDGIDSGDALLRVLGMVSVQQAGLMQVSFSCSHNEFSAKLEIEGLGVQRAEHLKRRLAQLPFVRSVSHGWCS